MAFNLFKKREAPVEREDTQAAEETPSDILLRIVTSLIRIVTTRWIT